MPDATADFVADDVSTGFGPALDTLGSRFTVDHGSDRPIRRTWLDTDDWLLHRAGMALEQDASPDGSLELLLHVAGEGDRRQPVADISWPAKIEALPAGPVRARIEDVIGIRALMPTATLTARQRALRVMNADRKTVVRLHIASSLRAGESHLADQLSVTAVRGYQDQADRVVARLSTVPGISPVDTSVYERALQANGRAFGDDVVEPVQLNPSIPASNAVISVLQGFLSIVERTRHGVIADIDTEFLHDFRVAIRRSRSTLKLVGDVLEPGPAEQLSRDLKWLGDLTSPTRDLDVYLLGLPDLAAGLQSGHPADLAPFGKYGVASENLSAGVRDEGSRDVQHQGWRREDVDGGEPRLPLGQGRRADPALGPRPARCGKLSVPDQAAGQGWRQGADPAEIIT